MHICVGTQPGALMMTVPIQRHQDLAVCAHRDIQEYIVVSIKKKPSEQSYDTH